MTQSHDIDEVDGGEEPASIAGAEPHDVTRVGLGAFGVACAWFAEQQEAD